jgi:hypothetical protein
MSGATSSSISGVETMKKALLCGLFTLLAATAFAPLSAQAEPRADPRDRMVPEGAAAPATDNIGEPWWMPLGECVAVFQQAQDNAKANRFARLAMTRIMEDRAVKANEAAAVVVAWTKTLGGERARVMIGLFTLEEVLPRCDRLERQYAAS